MLEPRDTVDFLDKLEKKGFNDEHMRIVHFKTDETVDKHRQYAKSTSKFHNGSRNLIVCQRLQYIVNNASLDDNSNDFVELATSAAINIPMPASI